MTLAEIANFICRKVGQTDASSVSVCSGFVNARAEEVYDVAAWREAQVMVTANSDANDSSIVFLPQFVDRVIGVRLNATDNGPGWTSLSPMELATVMQYDASLWDQSGAPIFFSQQPPSAIPSVPPGTPPEFAVYLHSASIFAANGSPLPPAIQSDEGAQILLTGNVYNGGGGSPGVVGFSTQSEYITLGIYSFSIGPGSDYFVYGQGKLNFTNLASISVPAALQNSLFVSYGSSSDGSIPASLSTGSILQAGRTTSDSIPSIKLLNPPTTSQAVLVLAKIRFVPMLDPNSQFQLRGFDNVLLAMAQGDMLERQRQYGKAQQKFSEGKALLEIMLDIERNQTSTNTRIIPALIHSAGIGWDGLFGEAGKGFF